jgi:hypothetical protein
MPVQCPHCRTWNRDGATYCDKCGQRLGAAPAPAPGPGRVIHKLAAIVPARRTPYKVPKVTGEVRGLQERQELQTTGGITIIWTFLVESYDTAGNRLPTVPVEMRGGSFTGVLNEGHQVEIDKKWREGETLNVKKVLNRTTGAWVCAK